MKKILFFILSLFMLVSGVNATTYVNTYYTITNKCAVVKDNKAVVPIVVKAGHDQVKLSDLIKGNRLGYVDNYKDIFSLKVSGVSNDSMEVYVDYNRDSDGRSLILFNIDKNIDLKKHEELVKFNIEVNILNDVKIDKINILENEVIFGDEATCEMINGYKINEVERIKYVDLSKADHKEYFEDLFNKVIIGVLSVALVVCIILLIKKKK